MRKILLAGLLAALPLSAAAHAESMRVPVTQADLGTEAGLATLYERIEMAAKRVCRREMLATSPGLDRCITAAMEDAIANANIPALTTYHTAQNDRSAPAESTTLAAR